MEIATGVVIGLIILGILLALDTPIALSMFAAGFIVLAFMMDYSKAAVMLAGISYSSIATWVYSMVPLFLLMGLLAGKAKIVSNIFETLFKWFAHFPAGLGLATIVGAAIFGAISGSSIATAMILARTVTPQLIRRGYDKTFSVAICAVGGMLDNLIPPSITLVIYGVVAEQSIEKLFLAGFVPGAVSTINFVILILLWKWARPNLAPPFDRAVSWSEKLGALPNLWAPAVLASVVIFGIFFGLVTTSEAGALGAAAAMLFVLLRSRSRWADIMESLRDSALATGLIFFVLAGVTFFLAMSARSGLSTTLQGLIGTLTTDRWVFLGAIYLMYLFLGTFLEGLGMMLLTFPFVLPAMRGMGIDLVWFGIIMTKLIGIAMLTPPVGLTVYAVKAALPEDIPLERIFKGCGLFVIADIITLVLLTIFPEIVTFLPDVASKSFLAGK